MNMEDRIDIGSLDTKIEILKGEITNGERGERKKTYYHHSDVWAKVVRDQSEMVDNGNLQCSDAIEVTCYKIEGLNSRWRVKIDGTLYEIVGIDPISRISMFNKITLRIVE